MLKMTIHDASGQRRLKLEGRLAGAWVSELECCWHTAKPSHPNGTLAVDLTSMAFIHQAGRYLLQLIDRAGVRLVGSDSMGLDILDHMTGMTA